MSVSNRVNVVSIQAPSGLSASAASPYQINLSWNTTSGAVSYNIYRESVFLASTSNTYYSDSGLSPSTNYTYQVSAVNNSGSESAMSNSASATTLDLPVSEEEIFEGGALFIPPPPGDPSVAINDNLDYSDSYRVSLQLFARNAYLMIISNNPDFSDATWEDYSNSKTWLLPEGEGEKKVYAKFRSFAGGVSDIVSDSIILDFTPPLNVSDLEAESKDQQIILTWENPKDSDFKEVAIIRSTAFYPAHIYDGILVYKGSGIYFADNGVSNGVRYYYTVFSYDKAGNRSSGAVVSGFPRAYLATGIPPELPPEIPPEIPPLVPEEKVPPSVRELTLEDFDFIQEGKNLPIFEKEKLNVEPEKPLTISIDYEKLPEDLKTIMVVLKKDEKTFSFILKIDGEKKNYSAVILPPDPDKIYPFDIFIVNYKNQSLKKISGKMIVNKSGVLTAETMREKIKKCNLKFPILWLIILIIFLTYIIRRQRKKKELEKQEMEQNKNNSSFGLDSDFKKE